MIRLTPTFLSEYNNASKGLPGGLNTTIDIPEIIPNGKKVTVRYGGKSYLKNPVFPAELYEYRRGKKYETVN